MGTYLNPGRKRFQMSVASEIYVDKTEMIGYLNSVINTQQRFVSVSRPRRFGKTMAADMLCAYYGREADGRALFEKRKLSESARWDEFLGKFDVIRLVMTDFFKTGSSVAEGLKKLQRAVIRDLAYAYPDVYYYDREDFFQVIRDVYVDTDVQFVIIIDEWDAVFREYKEDKDGQKQYLDFLRDWLKDQEYVALAYMTGILPIKKYGKHSALNMFDEYSMTLPLQMAPYTGFTAEEVRELCAERNLVYQEFENWYDGYRLSNTVSPGILTDGAEVDQRIYRGYEIYSPYSVVKAIRTKRLENYWNQTETYEALQQYVDWDFDGLKEEVVIMMNGGKVRVDIKGYQNDMTSFQNKDDILTMFIHLGYLGYEMDSKEAFIPNKEVLDVFKSSTKSRDWSMIFKALENSRKLLESTWVCDEEKVAELIEAAHNKAGNRTYHTEAGLSYAVQLAYYAAQDYYTIIQEMDTGKGYADLAFIPKKPNIPAILVELKYNETADSAIRQILRQKYPDNLEHYKGNMILVGINYDKEVKNDQPRFKHHSCKIYKA